MAAYPDRRTIIHMDLDAFFVSVECLRNPELRGKPVIIGGNGNRGVVASCSYEARRFGIHSAMPARLARQLCPDALFISGDMEAYTNYSRLITDIIAERSPLFEKSSIDEFYIDITGMDRYVCHSLLWASELRKTIIKESGLPISMGLSINKLVSKVATNEAKPNGQREVKYGQEREFLAPLTVDKIPMIGEQTSQFLNDMGIRTVKVLREMPVRMLESALGRNGVTLWHKANGVDPTPVTPYSDRKSISTECTFGQDTIDVKKLKSILTAMVEKLAFKLRQERWLTACITVKIRYANFDTETRQARIPYTSSDQALIRTALDLFDKLYTRRMLLRLVGIRLSNLVHGHYQISLFDDTEESIRLYQAMDVIRNKYGIESLYRAVTQGLNKRIRMENNMFKG